MPFLSARRRAEPTYGAEELCHGLWGFTGKRALAQTGKLEAQAWMSVCLRNQLKAKPGTEILPECFIKNPPEMPGGVPGLSHLVIGSLWVWGSKLPSLWGVCCPHTLLVVGGA